MVSSFLTIRRATGGSSFSSARSAPAASWTVQAKALLHVRERHGAARSAAVRLDGLVIVQLLQGIGYQALH
jgi:hypothetical protein